MLFPQYEYLAQSFDFLSFYWTHFQHLLQRSGAAKLLANSLSCASTGQEHGKSSKGQKLFFYRPAQFRKGLEEMKIFKLIFLLLLYVLHVQCHTQVKSFRRQIIESAIPVRPIGTRHYQRLNFKRGGFEPWTILRGGYEPNDDVSEDPEKLQIELSNGGKIILTLEALQSLQRAFEIAKSRKHVEITPAHYFLAILLPPESSLRKMLVGESTSFDDVASAIEKSLNHGLSKLAAQNPGPKTIGMSSRLQDVLERAYSSSKAFGSNGPKDVPIPIEELILALADEGPVQAALQAANFPVKRLQQAAAARRRRAERSPDSDAPPQALEEFAHELVVDAERGRLDPVIGREEEIRRVIEILSRRTKNNPCLVGEPGVGKTAIVEGLAHRILAGDVPHGLNGTRIYSLDLAALYAGTKYRGELEERFRRIMREVEAARGRVLLFIDEIHMLLGGAGGEDAHSLANLLKPALARGLRCIGATTNNEYRTHIERDGAFERRFQKAPTPIPTRRPCPTAPSRSVPCVRL